MGECGTLVVQGLRLCSQCRDAGGGSHMLQPGAAKFKKKKKWVSGKAVREL